MANASSDNSTTTVGAGNGGRDRVGARADNNHRQQSTNELTSGSNSGNNGICGGIQCGGNGGGGCSSATVAWGAMRIDDNGGCDKWSLNDVICVR